ncbi:ACT domain-containing protein [Rothia kristinae]|uniref:ACT domain-containing protein n=1 Tax=Rothia kristinae TaxID=37923 RepID=UPI0007740D96|nr:ACT domain-containing protein [Rothia kristinae]SQC37603.1 ACT domain-containing protein [Rothia kristinae]
MKIILTVTGPDRVGIIAAVATRLAALEVNILNVSQTLMDGYFTMIMQGSFDDAAGSIEAIQEDMAAVQEQTGVIVRIQSEAIFDAMHQL